MVLTRRAYRQRMEISRWLPNEVLVQIIQHSLKADQATLSRVSKLFRELCLPVLYRAVQFKDSHSINLFCLAIKRHLTRADSVRSFTLLDMPYNNRIHIRSDLILSTLKRMSRLNYLSLSTLTLDNNQLLILLEEANFPQLISCGLRVPCDLSDIFSTKRADLVAVFLTRHPTLKRVHVDSEFRTVASQSVRVFSPNLESYTGDAAFFLAIEPSSLKEAHLTWYFADDVDKITTAVSSTIKLDMPFVSSHRYLDDPCQIVTSVSKHMRHTKTLRLQSLRNSFTLLSQDIIRHITECLPRFTGLIYLEIGYRANFYRPPGRNDVDRIVAERWGEACPTLEACGLNLHAWKKGDDRWEAFPIKEFWVLVGLQDPATSY
ncbi:F-box domain-containing protein [Mycena sanguinolenta]|uniref:F-box domain-containing protein n=1 Tax=Mycena sanguinolenta TaxID=230812 RepID=A0A8H6YMS0_9AGAR|nr:F-box domain-containing protein [Mycena sanguinolenta]